MNLAEDQGIFFADFGTPAVIKRPGLPDQTVQVLFDLNSIDQSGLLTDKPQITIPESCLTDMDLKTATITVIGKYPEARIMKPLPDGSGLTVAGLARI